jgi:hypothetical protein
MVTQMTVMSWKYCVPSSKNFINQNATQHTFFAPLLQMPSLSTRDFPAKRALRKKMSAKLAHLLRQRKTTWYLHSAFDFHKQLEFTVRPELVQLVHHL